VISGSATLRSQPRIPTIAWLAGDDRIGHAQSPGAVRTMCDQPATFLRFAWPEQTRCAECSRLVEVRR
jgi:hypothetical protein